MPPFLRTPIDLTRALTGALTGALTREHVQVTMTFPQPRGQVWRGEGISRNTETRKGSSALLPAPSVSDHALTNVAME